MDVRPIETKEDYEWALREIAQYFDNEPVRGTPEADRFSVLATLIGAYEETHWRIDAPDPIDAIMQVMEHRRLTQADLGILLGSRSRASELLTRKRQITMDQAYKLHHQWGIPADLLLRPAVAEEPRQASGLATQALREGQPMAPSHGN